MPAILASLLPGLPRRRGLTGLLLPVALTLALLLNGAGCASLLGAARSQEPASSPEELDPPQGQAYYHYLKAQQHLLHDDLEAAAREYEEAVKLDPNSSQLELELAAVYQRQGDLTKALAHVEKALKLDPKNQDAHFLLAGLQVGLNKLKEAIAEYEHILVLDAENLEARLFLAALYAQQKRFPKAVRTIQEVLARKPQHLVAHYYLGRFYLEMNQVDRAKQSFNRVLSMDPQFIPAIFELAGAYEREKQYSRALNLYRRVIKLQPQNSRAWANLGRIHLFLRHYSEAGRIFRRVKALEKNDAQAFIQIGAIYLEQKYFQEAIQEFRRALDNPRFQDQVRYYIGLALEEKGDLEAAVREYQSVGRGTDFYVPARLRLAYLCFQLEKKELARRHLDDLKTYAPDREEVYLTISYLYEEEGLWHRSLAVLQEGVDKLPKSAELFSRLASVYEKQKNQEGAVRYIKKALELEPDNPDFLNFLGYIYADAGINLDEAEQLIKAALRAKPESGHIIDSLGWVYYKKGRYDKAVEELERAYRILSHDATVAEHLADAYVKVNRLREALKLYRRAMTLESPETLRLRQKIRELEIRLREQSL
ncbi:MAG: tetratricopeptide repeat protein [Deltaproteobacteria bacterium]|nr:tetratricopeptide repeat protein [Deltaproteobacteria bacterium]